MKKRHKMSNARRGVVFALVLVGLLLILGTMAMMAERQIYTPPVTTPTGENAADPTETKPTEPPTEATMPTLAADAMNGKQVLNILITGQDRREDDRWGRSDTMILCSINARTNTVTMVSFLRDLYLPIPGHGSSRLNAA